MNTTGMELGPFGIKLLTAAAFGLVLTAGGAFAQDEVTAEEAARIAEREALVVELEAKRAELGEQARELAELERELLMSEGELERTVEAALAAAESQVEVIVRQLKDGQIHHQVSHHQTPKLGVLLDINNDGYEVIGLTENSGAGEAGVEAGDVLISVNGVELSLSDSVTDAMHDVSVDDEVVVVVDRDGEVLTFDVKPSAPGDDVNVFFNSNPMIAGLNIDVERIEKDLEGVEQQIMLLNDGGGAFSYSFGMPGLFSLGSDSEMISNHEGLAPYFGTADGVVVLKIDPENPLGLIDGDVVLAVNGEELDRPVDLGRAMIDLDAGETVDIQVMRNQRMETVQGEVPESRIPVFQKAPKPPKPPKVWKVEKAPKPPKAGDLI